MDMFLIVVHMLISLFSLENVFLPYNFHFRLNHPEINSNYTYDDNKHNFEGLNMKAAINFNTG